jgi:hypothetical protein
MRKESRRRNSSSDFGMGDLDFCPELFEVPPLVRFCGGKSRSFRRRFFGASSGNVSGCFAMILVLSPRIATFDQFRSSLSIKMI